MNMKAICNYAVIRFLPYPETEEFANIGIVMICNRPRRFEFRIETRRRDRITRFFPEMDPGIYTTARTLCDKELQRVAQMVNPDEDAGQHELDLDEKSLINLFKEVVRPRESIMRYSGIRTVATDHPETTLEALFEHYVERQFANQHVYQEKVMHKRLARFLKEQKLDNLFKERTFLDPETDYKVKLPFVKEKEGKVLRAIKPLHLDKRDATSILEHGDRWCSRLERLNKLTDHPEHLLFVIKEPDDKKKKNAAGEVLEKIKAQGAETVNEENKQALRDFASEA